jgi:nucleoside-diphosphate-sugar epimerase
MRSTGESHSAASVSLLSATLEVTPHLRRYYLSRKAKDGILRRAARRGRKLPPLLELCKHYRRDYGLETRIARLHNVYGPYGTYQGGREKAPAAFCRKVAEAKRDGATAIDMWGDGEQTRSFCYVDDCVEGLWRLMQSDYAEPLNIGSERLISMNDLARLVMQIAGVELDIHHIDGPQGVRGRNSDNTLIRQVLGWEPTTPLEVGLGETYAWIEQQVGA